MRLAPNTSPTGANGLVNPITTAGTSATSPVASRKPVYPSATGYTQIPSGSTPYYPAPTIDPAAGVYDAPYTPVATPYQYWTFNFMPYFQTQFIVKSIVLLSQIFTLDISLTLESFKGQFWTDLAVWYQYSNSNPSNPTTGTSGPYTVKAGD